MEHKTFSPTPKDDLKAVTFLRDEVRKGKLAMAPLLRKKLQQIGLFREAAFQRLLDEGRRAFLSRTRAADAEFQHDVDALAEYAPTNREFSAKVKVYVDAVAKARSEREAYARIDALRSFLAEFQFASPEFLRQALGEALWHKYLSREKDEPVDETEESEIP
jgi:hypothetical protein